jgi:hypothetical protein
MGFGGFALAVRGFSGRYQCMALPITGSAELLELLSPFVADDHINEVLPRHRGAGRPSQWSGAQLYRTLLLMLLTPARSSNLLCTLLPEQRACRRFAHLPNRNRLPNARQLHEFRHRLTLPGIEVWLNFPIFTSSLGSPRAKVAQGSGRSRVAQKSLSTQQYDSVGEQSHDPSKVEAVEKESS